MKVCVARLLAFAGVSTFACYLAGAQSELARLNRELRDDTAYSDRLDELNAQMHHRLSAKLNISEDAVRYGSR